MAGRLYVLPSPIFDIDIQQISPHQRKVMTGLMHFGIENIKPARRFIRKLIKDKDIDDCTFYAFGKHDDPLESSKDAIKALITGFDIGLLSDAGCPGIADPGNILVQEAHRQNIQVEPIAGPSSIFMALMAAGLNGQQFRFHGYLPHKSDALKKVLQSLEQQAHRSSETQIFIETPYRNKPLLETCKQVLQKNTRLSIACDLGNPNGFVITKEMRFWEMEKLDVHKRPAVFLIG